VKELKEISSSSGATDGEISHLKCDIRQNDDVEKLMKHAIEKYSSISYLVNNGGGQFPVAAECTSENGWQAVIDTNLNGTFRMCKEAAVSGKMRENGGSIVNIICTHHQGFPGMAHTGAARAGVDNLTRSLAVEWAEFGIRINSVAPGIIYSSTAEKNYESMQDRYLSSQASKIPMRRLGTTQEVANVVIFLLSTGGSYTSGMTYIVDGGLTCSGSVGSDAFLRRSKLKHTRELFPVEGDLPDFCIADDHTVPIFADTNTDVEKEIQELEMKLNFLRGEGKR